MNINTPETVTLIGALCDQLKWMRSYGGGRAEHLKIVNRLTELCKSLPEDRDSA